MPNADSSDADDAGDVAGGVGGRRGVVVEFASSPPLEGRRFEEAEDSLAEDSNTLPHMSHRIQVERKKMGAKTLACRFTAGRHFPFFFKRNIPNVDDAANEHSALVASPYPWRG